MKPVNNLLGQTFGRLIVIERAPNPGTRKNDTAAYWNCLCKCGKYAVIRGYSLTTGKTQSCGCLKWEAPHLAPFAFPKYSPDIAAAKAIWRNRYKEVLFEEFYGLSQQNCFYCDLPPSLRKKGRQKDISKIFIFNTLDRIDSSKGHIIDNVIPACLICNRAKLDRTLEAFQQYMLDLINHERISPQTCRELALKIELTPFHDEEKYALLTSIKSTFAFYQEDHPGNITLEQFYQLTQMNCFYCGVEPFNKRSACNKQSSTYAKQTGTFIYGGLDRIDSNLPHDYTNCVPCCKYCNSAKQGMMLQEFYAWLDRLAIKHVKLP